MKASLILSPRALLVAGAALGMGLTTGCGSDDGSSDMSNDVTGELSEWKVKVSSKGAAAGPVTFTITNKGTIEHEFLVVKTDIPVGEIPLVDDKFEEEADGIEVIDEIAEFPKGETQTLEVDLAPGNYQLVCNIKGHYGSGMHTGFVVE